MPELIEALPGIRLPVEEVTDRLNRMWEVDDSGQASSAFRASQMNVVLHLGSEVSPAHARACFDGLISFGQRYPSRMIILCPTHNGSGSMKAKLFSQCYIGSSHREMCCCEALLLSYEPDDAGYLSNQVSTWLESDLPVYHWFSGVPRHRIAGYFKNLLIGVRRFVYDSSIEPDDLSELEWPEPQRVCDLAKARILPVRQSIGQYLSGHSMEVLCRGLKTISVRYAPGFVGEAKALAAWIESCLGIYLEDKSTVCRACPFEQSANKDSVSAGLSLSMQWDYINDDFLHWQMFEDGSSGKIKTRLSGREESVSAQIKLLSPEHALAEALFF